MNERTTNATGSANRHNFRRVRYVGDHPFIKWKCGDTYYDNYQDCDLFRPDKEPGDEKSEWYRVKYENLEWLDGKRHLRR